jgi:hypothetical protein
VPKLSDTQKTGKEPVYSFAQLAALMKTKDEPPAEEAKALQAAEPAPPQTPEEPRPETPPEG